MDSVMNEDTASVIRRHGMSVVMLLSVALLAGCASGGYGWIYAQQDMNESRAAYKACLAEKEGVEDCEAERLMYEADLSSYKAIRGESPEKVELIEN